MADLGGFSAFQRCSAAMWSSEAATSTVAAPMAHTADPAKIDATKVHHATTITRRAVRTTRGRVINLDGTLRAWTDSKVMTP